MTETPSFAGARPAGTRSDVRVRFCPSPTGVPHVGNIRTALFNWAFARHVGGTFVFRIEDTDPARDSQESYEMLLEALRWLELDWDEGVEVGGPYGPYRQSERFDIYREVAARLVSEGYAYESFSTAEEIEARNLAAGRPAQWGYDGFDRTLTEEQKAAYRREGREPSIRLRMPDEDVTFTDLIRGEITFKAGAVPDYVIVRSGGHPLYTLVNPIDDALMRITHVLRGEDLLSSTPRQVVLYRALIELGYAESLPQFGHLPYVMGEGNKKLSKRDPESDLFLHRKRGFIPEGLVNYLALLGWSIAADRDIFSRDELIAAFDISDVLPNAARFDLKKAEAINAAHIRLLDVADFTARMVPYLHAASLVSAERFDDLSADQQEVLTQAAPLIQERIQLLGEAPGMLGFLFIADADVTIDDDARKELKPESRAIIATAIEKLDELDDFTTDTIHEVLRNALVDQLGVKPRLAFTPLRVAISGRRVSPPLFESMEILGKESTIARLVAVRDSL